MAEAWSRQVMAEVGLPLEGQHAKPVRDFLGKPAVHHLIIVCERTKSECPRLFLGALRRRFWPPPDPASVEGDPGKQLAAFREVRDDIHRRVLEWLREEER
jgi:protein-tyrosine-phosphatase